MVEYEAILFDLDGTICQRTGDAAAAYYKTFDKVETEQFGELNDLWRLLDGPPDPDDRVGYIATGFARLATIHDQQVDPVKLSKTFIDVIDDQAVGFTPGAEQAISLASENAQVGLITNGPRDRQMPKIESLGLGNRFETIIYAGDLYRRKPHVRPFTEALNELDVPAHRSAYVGNSLKYDVAGAFIAGLDSIWIRSDSDNNVSGYNPDWTLDSLEEFDRILETTD